MENDEKSRESFHARYIEGPGKSGHGKSRITVVEKLKFDIQCPVSSLDQKY